MSLAGRLRSLDRQFEEEIRAAGVPGATLAVMQGEEIFEVAAGVINRNTGVETTTDSVFQIGSITKLFTATLIMQLVEEGRVELDAPIWSYLPELHFADARATVEITVRQLLTHTGGIDGDFFEDTGRGDDCVARYILACRALPQLHAPGKLFSYCNAGFMVLGRLIEKLRGTAWDDALRTYLLNRIGTERAGTYPEEALLHRTAVGHIEHPESGEALAAPVWRLPPSNGPAGSTAFATSRDLLRFAHAFLEEGRCKGETRILEAKTVRESLATHFELPPFSIASAWGLGWMLFDWGEPLYGHDGATIGQASFLRLVPGHNLAIALLTNGGDAAALYRSVFGGLLDELCGISIPPRPAPDPGLDLDLSRYAGHYDRLSVGTRIEFVDQELRYTSTGLRGPMRLLPPTTGTLHAITREGFVLESAGPLNGSAMSFLEFQPDGRPGYLMAGSRCAPRQPEAD